MDVVLIRNRCALERIDRRFVPLVEASRSGVVACLGDRVRELRLQGSIARGDARRGQADLDMIALLEGPPAASDEACLAHLAKSLAAGTQLVSRFDLEAVDADALEPFRRFVLSSDSLCVHGVDSLTMPLQSIPRLTLVQLVTPDPSSLLPNYLQWVEELRDAADAERRFACRIIGKDLMKVLRGVLLLRGASYEVAVPRIAAQVPRIAPEAAEVAKRLIALYSEPTADLEIIRQTATHAVMLLETSPERSLLCNPDRSGFAT